MIKLRYQDELLFCSLNLKINNENLYLENVLIDSGSATTLINADYICLDGTEKILNVQGVGGCEKVLFKKIDTLQLDDFTLDNFFLSVGDMNYGIEMDCLLGLDLLKALGATINLNTLEMNFENTNTYK